MTDRPRSLRAAQRATKGLAVLFGQIGTAEHPRGAVLVAYRNARRAMRDVLRRKSVLARFEAREVMRGLRSSVRATAQLTLGKAVELGQAQAETEAEVWGLTTSSSYVDTSAMADAWVGVVDQQARQVAATLVLNDPSLILGGDDRLGILRPDTVTREGAHWLASAAMLAFTSALSPAMAATGRVWGKQAIANIDARTTPCCLGVHGQVVRVDVMFSTPDAPAYADEQDWWPFHDHCRTVGGLVPMDEADDELTAMLLEQAATERALRDEARARITDIMQELVGLDTIPDARRRKDDVGAVKKLRRELLGLRQRGGYPGGLELVKPDEALLLWRSGMTKKEAAEWLNSIESLNPTLTPAENAALDYYKRDGYFDINQDLRDAGYSEDDRADLIQQVIARSRTNQEMVAWRGAGWDVFDEDDLLGSIFSDDAFVSASLVEGVAKAHQDGVMIEIRIPAGANAINMERWTVAEFAEGEGELLLQSGSRFRVISDDIDDGPDIRRLIVELLL